MLFRSGYMYLADNEDFAGVLRANQAVQRAAGAETELLTPDEIAARYPFYNLDDIVLGSINLKNEGYWDGGSVFDWMRRSARENGVEYIRGEVVAMDRDIDRITGVKLSDGREIACGTVVNASGPRAVRTSRMAASACCSRSATAAMRWEAGREKSIDGASTHGQGNLAK